MNAISASTARRFHDATMYRYDGWHVVLGRRADHRPALGVQDPDLKPPPFKDASRYDGIALPRHPGSTVVSALDALSGTGADASGDAVPDLATLARLVQWSNGVFRRATLRGEPRTFRCYSSTGGLHHLELYVVCADLPGLGAGVYHYSAQDHTFRTLRAGDHRATVVEAAGHEPALADAPVVIVCTSTFWRNAWRYQERAYRHAFWDAGTLIASLAAMAGSEGMPLRVVAGFADRPVNDLVGADGDREAAIAILAVGRSSIPVPAPPGALLPLPPDEPYGGEIDYPLIREMHRASGLSTGCEALAWRANVPAELGGAVGSGRTIPLTPLAAGERPTESVVDLLARRRTYRHYDTPRPVSFDLFSTVLDHAVRGLPIDALDPAAPPPFVPHLVVNSVEGVEPGTYVVHPGAGSIEALETGDRRMDTWRVTGGNAGGRDAQVSVFALADPRPILDCFGDRGYRLLQLTAGIFAGQLQLAAQALRLGASAMSGADEDATALFGPRAGDSMFLIAAAFGHHRRRGSG